MRSLNFFFIVIFIFSAIVQYNDPDPIQWMAIYLLGAYICYQGMMKKYNYPLLYSGLIIYGIYAMFLLFKEDGVLTWLTDHDAENIAQTMKAEKPWIEQTREFFGLILLMIAISINIYHGRRTLIRRTKKEAAV